MRDEVTKLEKPYVGELIRLEIPLHSVSNLRRVAEELRGLAYQVDCIAKFQTDEPSVIMLQVRQMVRRTNKRLEVIRGRGRPKIGRQFKNTRKM